MKKSQYQQYFLCFIVCILAPYSFQFIYQQNIVTILISAEFRSAALSRGEAFIRGRCLFRCGYPKVRRFFEAQRLLEEKRYLKTKLNQVCVIVLGHWQLFYQYQKIQFCFQLYTDIWEIISYSQTNPYRTKARDINNSIFISSIIEQLMLISFLCFLGLVFLRKRSKGQVIH